jgi:hypothetical protein
MVGLAMRGTRCQQPSLSDGRWRSNPCIKNRVSTVGTAGRSGYDGSAPGEVSREPTLSVPDVPWDARGDFRLTEQTCTQMKANADHVAAVIAGLWGGWRLERYRLAQSADFTTYEHVDQAPEFGRQLADALAAEGLEIGGLLRTDQGVFFAGVIERLSPPIWASDERLIVDVLTEASRLQTEGKQELARPWAIAGVLMLLFIGLLALGSD